MASPLLRVAFAIPGDLSSPTGGYAYARALFAEWPALDVEAEHVVLSGSFPNPSEADLDETEHRLGLVPPDRVLLIDGLAFGAFPADLAAGIAAPVVALVHHPLSLETGLSAEKRDLLFASERAALACVRHVVATSETTARTLVADFSVPAEKLSVAEPGTNRVSRARGSGSANSVRLLAVGAVSARKGYEHLIAALAPLTHLGWHLDIVGSLARDPDAAASLRRAIEVAGLVDRVTLAGAVSDAALAESFDRTDILVSASLYEGYGMVLAEGLARGIPLVAATGGAAGETVPDGTGLKVSGGDVGALSDALRRMIGDPPLRQASADAAWAAGQNLPSWRDTAKRVTDALRAAR